MLKRSKHRSTRSKQREQWHKDLYAEWRLRGDTDRCEVCNGTFGLALAHAEKRRHIVSKEQYWEVALLCQICHERIEFSGHENMAQAIREIIAKRG
tara:strand:+ start:199 stop:486 length:288 start_codon:yes stop_codon:yes gene_type:complete